MKKILATFVLTIAFLSIPVQDAYGYGYGYGYGWQANPHISVSPMRVTATVVNYRYRPIVCSGYAYGRTRWGMTVNSWMSQQVIYPGQRANVYVYTNYSQPFVNAWADIRCRFL